MRILHTSDWHIGRTFHGHSTDDHLREVLAAVATAVTEHQVDVVIVAGDVFDSSTPKADSFTLLADALGAIRAGGAQVVLTSGNHDGPARLAHNAAFASAGGVHIKADHTDLSPVVLTDEHGDVAIYGLPYLHPEFVRSAYDDFSGSTHQEALEFAMARITADARARGNTKGSPRIVVAAHCFAAAGSTVPPETKEDTGRAEERDITRGGLNLVDISVFDGAELSPKPVYTALGHIHSRQTLSETVRYSGAPLRFSFGERSSLKGMWLVDLGADAVTDTQWLELPTPRAAMRLEGTLADLLVSVDPAAQGAWVEVVLTDDQLPRDAMRTLQEVYPHAVTLRHEPANRPPQGTADYAARVEGKTEAQVIEEFLAYVRNGAGASAAENALINDALDAIDQAEATR